MAAYTIQFQTVQYGRVVRSEHRDNIPPEDVLDRFDQAAHWAGNTSAPHTAYCAYVWGPGLRKTPCMGIYRAEVEQCLEAQGLLALDRPRFVALLWADLDNGYKASKVRKTTETLDGFERPNVTCYDLVPVEPDKVPLAFTWVSGRFWRDRGLWLGKPALLFSQHWQVTVDVLREIPQVAHLMVVDGEVYDAPVSFDWHGAGRQPYPYIKPTRTRTRIHEYRARWPLADDVKWTPKALLIKRHGYGPPSSLDAALGLAF